MALVVPSLSVDSRGCDVGLFSKSQKRKSRIKRNAIFRSKTLTEKLNALMANDEPQSCDVTPTVHDTLDARLCRIEHKLELLLNSQFVYDPTDDYADAIAGEVLASQCSAARSIQVAWKRRYNKLHAAAISIQCCFRRVNGRRKAACQRKLHTPEDMPVQENLQLDNLVQFASTRMIERVDYYPRSDIVCAHNHGRDQIVCKVGEPERKHLF